MDIDASRWKLLVDKAILRTETRDLQWSETDEGPANTLSFGASIDGRTTLNVWGYQANYSYELSLIRHTDGEPFAERKRVTVKSQAEGIDFKGLLDAARGQVENLVRERAFAAVMDYLADPTAKDPEQQEEFLDRWAALGYNNFFNYSQDESIFAIVNDLTAAGSITWTVSENEDLDAGGQCFLAEVGDLLSLTFHSNQASAKAASATTYTFCLSSTDDSDSDIEMQIGIGRADYERTRRLLADELHTHILKKVHEGEAMFNEIVRNSTFDEILASLDVSHHDSSSSEESE